ncbi:MAG TPA: type III pantothenate kinase [Firmicutes bacterium]|nr:type III pantothenate kinase [Bacillota bacterium]
MIMVLDVGNTQAVLGIYDGRHLLADCRLTTNRSRTVDEYGLLIQSFLANKGIDRSRLEAIVLSSVVPPVTGLFTKMCREYFHLEPLVVGPGIRTGLPIRYENPKEVGADRVVNAVAAIKLYGPPLIVVDFGTATTFCAINQKGEYLGGVIVPGLQISAEALFMKAAKLPRVELTPPQKVIGRNTVSSIQAGLIYGYTDLVDGLISRLQKEMSALLECGDGIKVVATGGLAELIAAESRRIEEVNPILTLEGLRIIYEMNKDQAGG